MIETLGHLVIALKGPERIHVGVDGLQAPWIGLADELVIPVEIE